MIGRHHRMVIGSALVLALVLAVVGVSGVLAYAVTRRTREIGVRMALGAQSRDVLKLVIGQGLKLTFVGVGLGLVASVMLTKTIKNLLFGVSATDPATFAAIALLLIAVAMLACFVPARRATNTGAHCVSRPATSWRRSGTRARWQHWGRPAQLSRNSARW